MYKHFVFINDIYIMNVLYICLNERIYKKSVTFLKTMYVIIFKLCIYYLKYVFTKLCIYVFKLFIIMYV